MTDRFTPEQRSVLMSRIRGRDTRPELSVRRQVHGMGYRYRLYRRDLPGRPDLVFPGRRKVIFVHGCFWHQHDCLRAGRPSSNRTFWDAKLDRNVARDRENVEALEGLGWSVLVIWECEVRDRDRLAERVSAFLGPPGSAGTARPRGRPPGEAPGGRASARTAVPSADPLQPRSPRS